MKFIRRFFLKHCTRWEFESLLGFPWWMLRNRITGRSLAMVNENGHWEVHAGKNNGQHGCIDTERKLRWTERRDQAKEKAFKTLCQ